MNIPGVLLPPWRGKVGMGGRRGASTRALRALSPPPSPSPIKGEGIEEGKSLPEIALDLDTHSYVAHLTDAVLAYCAS